MPDALAIVAAAGLDTSLELLKCSAVYGLAGESIVARLNSVYGLSGV